MSGSAVTDKEKKMAEVCLECVVCKRAREKQRGLAFLFVKWVERGLCPWCKAYEKVYGRKAHEAEGAPGPASPVGSRQ